MALKLKLPWGHFAEMTEHEKAITRWDMWWGPARHSDENTHRMCDEGIAAVHTGKYEGLQFNVFNQRELNVVEKYMKEHAPEIPYTWTRAL